MFSEYASRFLAQSQSQSRISNFVHPADNTEASSGTPLDKHRRKRQSFRNFSRGYHLRLGNPYQNSSYISNLNFTSRYSTAPDAPLFHSALGDFREDDEAERERETADLFALQKSRRAFASARLEESSETDLEASNESLEQNPNEVGRRIENHGRGRGIKSSWIGTGPSAQVEGKAPIKFREGDEKKPNLERSQGLILDIGKDNMEDIGLGSNIERDDPPDDYHFETSTGDSPPAFQNFRSTSKHEAINLPDTYYQQDFTTEMSRSNSPTNMMPETVPLMSEEAPMHDVFWGSLYLICLGGMFATFFLIFLHTETPKTTLGDTIYTTLHASFYLFAVDTVVSIFVSLFWLAMLRSFVRQLVYLILIIVPIVLLSFSFHPFIASFKFSSSRLSISDQALRWLSLIPGAFAILWVYTIYRGRNSLNRAIGILEFSSKILTANPGLLVMGFAVLGTVVCWTWLWLGMFTRIFLGGQLSSTLTRFIIDTSSWWLGVFFIMMYMWTLSVITGIQRSTTAATVSEWYFHRNSNRPPSRSGEVVTAAFIHSTTTLFGTICLMTLITLLIRLPFLVLPRRITGIMSVMAYSWIPIPIISLINPLTLTYAAIHSQPLQASARGLSQMSSLMPQVPTTTLTPRSFNAKSRQQTTLLPYRLAKLLLHATRFIMALALGFSGWVAASRKLKITLPEGTGIRGSAYAYIVGLVAGFIGWGVLGAIEGILSGILDASVVCWGSEKRIIGGGAYCLEAGYLFGEVRERDLP